MQVTVVVTEISEVIFSPVKHQLPSVSVSVDHLSGCHHRGPGLMMIEIQTLTLTFTVN